MTAPAVVPWDDAFIVMNETDNVGIARRRLVAGTVVETDGGCFALAAPISTGHKVARRPIKAGERVIRWGAPIGSTRTDVCLGDHVHLHNMKSDYIPTFKAGDTTHGGEESEA